MNSKPYVHIYLTSHVILMIIKFSIQSDYSHRFKKTGHKKVELMYSLLLLASASLHFAACESYSIILPSPLWNFGSVRTIRALSSVPIDLSISSHPIY